MGSVMGSGYYDENATAECLAIPNPGFVFSHWNDGNTQNPRYIHLSQDTALTAFFAEGCMYHVDLFSDNPSLGSVLGGGDYPSNSMVSISATPSSNAYAFYHWNDGNTLNPRTFRLTQDTSFSAFFTENWRYHVELHSGMPDWGSVEGEGDYFANSQVSNGVTTTPATLAPSPSRRTLSSWLSSKELMASSKLPTPKAVSPSAPTPPATGWRLCRARLWRQ